MGCERCLSVCQAYISMLLYTHDAPIGIVKILPKILCARLTFQCFAQCCYTHALCHCATIFPKILSVCRAHISMLKRPHPLNAAMHTKCKIILPKIFPKVITKVIAQILPKVSSVSQVHISMAPLNGCLCTQTVQCKITLPKILPSYDQSYYQNVEPGSHFNGSTQWFNGGAMHTKRVPPPTIPRLQG